MRELFKKITALPWRGGIADPWESAGRTSSCRCRGTLGTSTLGPGKLGSWKCSVPMTPHVCLLAGPSPSRSVGWSVCNNRGKLIFHAAKILFTTAKNTILTLIAMWFLKKNLKNNILSHFHAIGNLVYFGLKEHVSNP